MKNLFITLVYLIISPVFILATAFVILLGGVELLGTVFIKTGLNWYKHEETVLVIKHLLKKDQIKEIEEQ